MIIKCKKCGSVFTDDLINENEDGEAVEETCPYCGNDQLEEYDD